MSSTLINIEEFSRYLSKGLERNIAISAANIYNAEILANSQSACVIESKRLHPHDYNSKMWRKLQNQAKTTMMIIHTHRLTVTKPYFTINNANYGIIRGKLSKI